MVRPAGPSALLRWLTALGLCMSLGILVVGAVVLLGLRQDTWRMASIASENLVVVLSEDIARNLATYDLTLQAARDALQAANVSEEDPEIRRIAIFGRAASAEFLGSVMVVGADGRLMTSSTAMTPEPLYLGDRDYFQIHEQRKDAGLFVSRTFESRLRAKGPTVAISRRIDTADGSFGGIVVGTLRLAYFRDTFDRLDVGAKGLIAVVNRNGQLITNKPSATPEQVAQDFSNSSVLQGVGQTAAGQFTTTYAIDGVERLVSFRQIGPTPLVLVLGVSLEEIYAPWWHKAAVLGSMLGLLFLGNLGLCILFRREMQRRLKAEAALTVAAADMSVIASTDSLTGVANRRAFDAALNRAWRGAIRAQTPLSLLMLDADCFKLFNDTFGHPAGDEVLRQVAACIERCIRRPTDFAARYGGEEFTALLPETETEGAVVIAERIREAVAALCIANPGAPTGTLSVSVGVAVLRPQVGQKQDAIVAQADAALFDAKRAGRNRVIIRQNVAEPYLPGHLPGWAADGTGTTHDLTFSGPAGA